jgi:5-formyltetrahydrofolate cyclo-ligase
MKNILRDTILSRRNSIPEEQRKEKSVLIKEQLFNLEEYHKANNILFYVSTKSEVLTEDMIKESINKGKKVFVPITDITTKQLIISELHDFDTELAPSTYGILEPKKIYHRIVSIDNIDMVIVPGIVFDLHGNRIGYGGGYYDRLLSSVAEDVYVIGLCFECQLIDAIPAEWHDMLVKKIITEKRVIVCKAL